MAGGRPTVYKPENAEIARHACLLGASNETLAERFDVTRRTIDNWIAANPEFGDAVRHGRQIADESVVAALYARATGMERISVKVVESDDGPVKTTQTVQALPDVRACIFWLRNRRPGEWREDRKPPPEAEHEDGVSDEWLEAAEERMRRFDLEESAKAEAARGDAGAALGSPAERLQVIA